MGVFRIPVGIVDFLIQSYYTGNSVQPEVRKVRLRGMQGVTILNLKVILNII